MKKKVIILIILLVLFLNGCGKKEIIEEKSIKDKAIEDCIELCKTSNLDLDKSPCLSNNLAEDWVCDVAHSPRQDIDNLSENQCSLYREGLAHHFIELDTECEVIKVY